MNINENSKLTKNFTIKEYAYGIFKTQAAKYNEPIKIMPETLIHAQLLQEFRDYYGKGITVNAWFRGPKFNKSVGGTDNSGHLLGTATDCAIKVSEKTFMEYWKKWQELCKKYNVVPAMGYYPTDGFIHLESCVKWASKPTYWKKVGNKLVYGF